MIQKNSLLALIIGLILYGFTQLNTVASWYLLLCSEYKNIPFLKYYLIISKSQISKYIPGNFSHLIGRSYLSKLTGIKIRDVAKSLIAETILVIYVGVLIGSFYFTYFDGELLGYKRDWYTLVIVILTIFLMLLLLMLGKNKGLLIPLKYFLIILTLYSASFFALGLMLYLFQFLLFDTSVSLVQFIIIAAISFVVGFVMPGSPAGIGVREYVFITLLNTEVQVEEALALSLMFRLATICGDVLFFFSSNLFNREKHYG